MVSIKNNARIPSTHATHCNFSCNVLFTRDPIRNDPVVAALFLRETDGHAVAYVQQRREPLIRREGLRSDIWVLMDFGCVIVHVFTDEARRFYNLERLWSDSETIEPSSLTRP